MFCQGERILVAVSGGVDSMVLLAAMHELAGAADWKLSVAHFNHQLRGRASAADERFVGQAAGKLGVPFYAGRGAVQSFAKKRGVSIEMAARELRHKFLAQTARRLKCPVVALAHHADDQVELFFLRLLRGASGAGLAGMKATGISPAYRAVRLVRPLLAVDKAQLLEFARAEGVRFREDASNSSLDILRNRVRQELLPLLREKYQPALNRTVLRAAEILGAEAEVVGALARAARAGQGQSFNFAAQAVAVQRRIIEQQLQTHRVGADFDLIESLRLRPGAAVSVGPRLSVVLDEAGGVRLQQAVVFWNSKITVNLRGRSGRLRFANLECVWKFISERGAKPVVKAAGREFFDADQVGRSIVLRHWQPGDRFQPIGMKKAVKLQDWFTNQKIPAARRRELVVATTARGDIFWVEGMRIGERFKLTLATRKTLEWRWDLAAVG